MGLRAVVVVLPIPAGVGVHGVSEAFLHLLLRPVAAAGEGQGWLGVGIWVCGVEEGNKLLYRSGSLIAAGACCWAPRLQAMTASWGRGASEVAKLKAATWQENAALLESAFQYVNQVTEWLAKKASPGRGGPEVEDYLPMPQAFTTPWGPHDCINFKAAREVRSYFEPVPAFAGAVDGALAGEPGPDPVVVGRFVELVVVAGALVWLDAIVWLPVL